VSGKECASNREGAISESLRLQLEGDPLRDIDILQGECGMLRLAGEKTEYKLFVTHSEGLADHIGEFTNK